MKLKTLKTIESALNDAIMAERAKAEVARENLKNACGTQFRFTKQTRSNIKNAISRRQI